MFVRYQTVRNVVLVAVAGGVIWALVGYFRVSRQPAPPGRAPAPAPASASATGPATAPATAPATGPATAPPAAPAAPGLAPPAAASLERAEVLAAFNGRARGPKAKDALGPGRPKVNLYDDDGDGTWDRAKVDDNRDGTWDERWTRKGGRVERKRANGSVLRWTGTGWSP